VIWQDCAVRDNDGRKLDHKTLEALRIRAVGQVGEGAHPEDVAAALGHPAHRATATKQFAASTDGRLSLIFLPGCSPELNPDEWVWKNVKHDRIGKTDVTSKADLKAKAVGALRRLQKRPGLVRAFFADPHLRYITA
jgi:DDE superfamily endonuclease